MHVCVCLDVCAWMCECAWMCVCLDLLWSERGWLERNLKRDPCFISGEGGGAAGEEGGSCQRSEFRVYHTI